MNTLRGRFILSHILPLLLVLPLVSAITSFALETQVLLAALAQELTDQAQAVAQETTHDPALWVDAHRAQLFADEMGTLLNRRVLLFHSNGTMLASSDPDVNQAPAVRALDAVTAGGPSVRMSYGFLRQSVQVLVPVATVDSGLLGIVGVTHTLEGLASQVGRLRRWIIGTLFVELVLGSVAGLVLARRLERPIAEVSDAVTAIASGQRIEPVPEEGPIEIERLAEAVNFLAKRLRLLEETRRHLLANIIHELGRPLGAIRAAVHVLIQGAGDDPDIRQELLAGVDEEVKRMQPLLDDLADLHGQVLGTLELARQPVPLGKWLASVLQPWQAAAADKGLQWRADIPSDLPELDLDPGRMAQVVGNLLSNAVKFTPVSGTVSVAAGCDEDEAWIQVRDTGPGIKPDEQQRVFEPFYRSHDGRRFPQGLGLGLTIARDLAEAHGGRLELISVPGEGSCFSVYLPLTS